VPASAGLDPATGTLLVRGEFPNPDLVLRPGQYARVRAITETKKAALLVPQRAISELQGVFQVAVVGAGDKVELRVVEPGVRDGSLQVVEKGLAAGERVVVEGIQKVRAGSVVTPKAAAEPAPAAAGR
jgi:membrane fusion protein (multidrug efflux system)